MIKKDKVPEEWQATPNQLRQKDVDVRWKKKMNQNHYGYKNHINVDIKYKLIKKFVVAPALQEDMRCLKPLLDDRNPVKKLWGDSAYRSVETEYYLTEKGYQSYIYQCPRKGGWISEKD